MNPRRVTLVVVLLAALTGCGSIQERIGEAVVEKAIEAGTDGKVDIDVSGDGEGSIRIQTEDGGDLVLGSGASLPDGWPSEVRIPSGLQVVSSYSTEVNGEYSASVIGTLDVAYAQALKEAQGILNGSGFTASADVYELTSDEMNTWAGSADDGEWSLYVQVMSTADGTNFVITVSPSTA